MLWVCDLIIIFTYMQFELLWTNPGKWEPGISKASKQTNKKQKQNKKELVNFQ